MSQTEKIHFIWVYQWLAIYTWKQNQIYKCMNLYLAKWYSIPLAKYCLVIDPSL